MSALLAAEERAAMLSPSPYHTPPHLQPGSTGGMLRANPLVVPAPLHHRIYDLQKGK